MDNSKIHPVADPVAVMLEARSVALVGASPRPGGLGARMINEVAKSPRRPRTYLVNPRYGEIDGDRCYPGLAHLPEPVDLALLAVPDTALEEQVRVAAAAGTRSAVIFGSAVDPSGHLNPGPGSPARPAPYVPPFPDSFAVAGPRGPGLRERSRRSPWTRGWPCAAAGAWGS